MGCLKSCILSRMRLNIWLQISRGGRKDAISGKAEIKACIAPVCFWVLGR